MDKSLLRKGKTTHGSIRIEIEAVSRIRTKSGEFWLLRSRLRGSCEVMKKRFERWQQKKRFILRMWKRGYKGMPKQGWIKWSW